MKKISLLTAVLSMSLAVFAQSTHREKDRDRDNDRSRLTTTMTVAPRFGVKAGFNMSEFKENSANSSNALPNTQNRGSFNAGFLYNLPLGPMFRLQPELIYNGLGSKASGSYTDPINGNTNYNVTSRLGYISLPVLLQLQTMSGFFVEVGPQIGYLISAKSQSTTANSNSGEVNIKDQLRKMDMGATGGIGYLSRMGLGIDARYYYGLRNIYNTENNNNAGMPEVKNRSIQVGLFYQFGAGK